MIKRVSDENKFYKILFGVLVIAIAVYGWHCNSIGKGSVHSNGAGADAVADRIESAKELGQQADAEREKAAAGIAGAERAAERIAAGLEQSADYNSQLSASIDRCQQTLDGIRKRGKIEAPES